MFGNEQLVWGLFVCKNGRVCWCDKTEDRSGRKDGCALGRKEGCLGLDGLCGAKSAGWLFPDKKRILMLKNNFHQVKNYFYLPKYKNRNSSNK